MICYSRGTLNFTLAMRSTCYDASHNETNAPGWMDSKHFLIIGAQGTVRDVDVRDGVFYYQIVFDAESWLDDKRIERPLPLIDGIHIASLNLLGRFW